MPEKKLKWGLLTKAAAFEKAASIRVRTVYPKGERATNFWAGTANR